MPRPVGRAVLNYYGGKYRIAPWVVEHLPDHNTYVEPFCGAASVLFAKPRAKREIINDLNEDVVNLFTVLRDSQMSGDLKRRLRLTPYARVEFLAALQPSADPVERARRAVVRGHMAYSNVGNHRATGFRTRGTAAAGWVGWQGELDKITARLQGVVIECRPALEIIAMADGPETLFYLDPPYVLATRASPTRVYRHEMEDRDHLELLQVLRSLRGRVALSGYDGPLYADQLPGWRRLRRQTRNGAAALVVETLWLNY